MYSFGHHKSVLCSHSWWTAENSAAYLLKYLQPTMHILNVGCGPGMIMASFARLVPQGHVTGINNALDAADLDMLAHASRHAAQQGPTNITFAHSDACNLANIPDMTYDIIHCHQVLQHLVNPVQALKEMQRVAKLGSIITTHESDSGMFVWYPEMAALDVWVRVCRAVAWASGTEPDVGRWLVVWVLEAGFEWSAVEVTAGTWCFIAPEERGWGGGMWADQMVHSRMATHAMEGGIMDRETLEDCGGLAGMGGDEGWLVFAHTWRDCVPRVDTELS